MGIGLYSFGSLSEVEYLNVRLHLLGLEGRLVVVIV